MTDLDALLLAILHNPEDDAPRLIYADALDETAGDMVCEPCAGSGRVDNRLASGVLGEKQCRECQGSGRVPNGNAERAEFIRVGVELASLDHYHLSCTGPKCPGCSHLRDRATSLLVWNRNKWGHGFETYPNCLAKFRRGLIESITCQVGPDPYPIRAFELFKTHPITSVAITDKSPHPNVRQYRWLHRDAEYQDHMMLPISIFELLPTGKGCTLIRDAGVNWSSTYSVRDYRTEKAAMTALSDACVAFGRKHAGLPPLPQNDTSHRP